MLKIFQTIGRWLGLIEAEPRTQQPAEKQKAGGLDTATQALPPPDSRRLFPDPEAANRAAAEKRARQIVSNAIAERPNAPLEVKVDSLDNVSTLFYIGKPLTLDELSPEARAFAAQGRISLHWNEEANVGIIVSERGALHAEMAPRLVNPAYSSFKGLATDGRIVLGGTRHRNGYYRNSTRFDMLPGEEAEKKFLKLVPERKTEAPKLSPSLLTRSFDPDQARPGVWSIRDTAVQAPREQVAQEPKKHTWISLREPGSDAGLAEQLAKYREIMRERGVPGY